MLENGENYDLVVVEIVVLLFDCKYAAYVVDGISLCAVVAFASSMVHSRSARGLIAAYMPTVVKPTLHCQYL